jgi:hypothetical protein
LAWSNAIPMVGTWELPMPPMMRATRYSNAPPTRSGISGYHLKEKIGALWDPHGVLFASRTL